jgi:hypothetical protein
MIRQKELEFWKTTFTTMAAQSAMLTGFCYGGLSIDAEKKSWVINFGYLSVTTCAMGFGLLTIVIGSLCGMLGPGLALRGPDGPKSVHMAVDVMKSEAVACFGFFMLQLFFFHLSSFSLMWILYSSRVAIIVNIVLAFFLVLFLVNGFTIWNKLHVSEKDAVSGQF